MEEKIRIALSKGLEELGASDVSFVVERPGEVSHGDYATNAALVSAKQLGKNPKDIAEALSTFLSKELGDVVSSVTVAGPGFVNITLTKEAVHANIREAAELQSRWGSESSQKNQRVLVEYSCPNPFKEMHIGHLMSTIIGEAVSRIIENTGATVLRDTYGGDVGPHVARALWSLQKNKVTDVASASEVDKAYLQGAQAYEKSEEAKQEIDALNQAIYEGEDQSLMDLWRKAREVCLASFRDLYDILGTKFDYYFFESEVTPIGLEVVRDGVTKGVFTESEGAVIYDGEKKGLHTLVFITSRGTPTYEAKDIGLAFYKEQHVPSDAVIIETGAEQIGHFKVFLAALSEIAPNVASKTSHISHGLMVDKAGKKLSSRLGNAVTAHELVQSVITEAQKRNEDPYIAQQVAVGAIKYLILRQAPGSNVVFDLEKLLSLEGDSGPYLQYSLVRARKLLTYESQGGGDKVPETPFEIERALMHYPATVARAAKERAPQYITHYLMELASLFNAFYANEQVLGSEEETYKLEVAKAFAVTMENGLSLLGIPAPERM